MDVKLLKRDFIRMQALGAACIPELYIELFLQNHAPN